MNFLNEQESADERKKRMELRLKKAKEKSKSVKSTGKTTPPETKPKEKVEDVSDIKINLRWTKSESLIQNTDFLRAIQKSLDNKDKSQNVY
jgi:hypothetical protein